jgi:hypothetical protein
LLAPDPPAHLPTHPPAPFPGPSFTAAAAAFSSAPTSLLPISTLSRNINPSLDLDDDDAISIFTHHHTACVRPRLNSTAAVLSFIAASRIASFFFDAQRASLG